MASVADARASCSNPIPNANPNPSPNANLTLALKLALTLTRMLTRPVHRPTHARAALLDGVTVPLLRGVAAHGQAAAAAHPVRHRARRRAEHRPAVSRRVGGCVDTHLPEPPYCTCGLRVPASCVLYLPKAQGSLARERHYCTYPVRVSASGVPYAPRTVAPHRWEEWVIDNKPGITSTRAWFMPNQPDEAYAAS